MSEHYLLSQPPCMEMPDKWDSTDREDRSWWWEAIASATLCQACPMLRECSIYCAGSLSVDLHATGVWGGVVITEGQEREKARQLHVDWAARRELSEYEWRAQFVKAAAALNQAVIGAPDQV